VSIYHLHIYQKISQSSITHYMYVIDRECACISPYRVVPVYTRVVPVYTRVVSVYTIGVITSLLRRPENYINNITAYQ